MADGKRGRRRKTAAEVKRDSSDYRSSRHGERPVEAEGEPQKPYGWAKRNKVANAYWDDIVPHLIETGLVGYMDSPQIVLLCESWARLCKVSQDLNASMLDVQRAQNMYQDVMSNFPLSPKHRQRLRDWTPPAGKEDDFAEFEGPKIAATG